MNKFFLAYGPEESESYKAFTSNDQPGDQYLLPALQKLGVQGRILDYGCGMGHSISQLLVLGANEVVGVEPSQGMFEEAQKRFRDTPSVRLEHLQALPLPYENKSFDGILCRFVFHYILDTEEVLREMSRVVKPNGWLAALFSDVQFEPGYEHLENGILPLRFNDAMTVRTLAKPGKEIVENAIKAGFSIERYEVLPPDGTIALIDESYPHRDKVHLSPALLIARK